jgi:hypothetical protein
MEHSPAKVTGRNTRTVALGLAAALMLPAMAAADPVALTVSTNPSLQQTENRPCIIGEPSCHNPDGFDFTLLAPHMPAGVVDSPIYTAAQIRGVVGGDEFWVGIDLNQAPGQNGGIYDLLSFTLAINGAVAFSTTGATPLLFTSPGNGFSDAGIFGFNLAGLAANAALQFTTTFAGGSGGREQYFLQPVAAVGGGGGGGVGGGGGGGGGGVGGGGGAGGGGGVGGFGGGSGGGTDVAPVPEPTSMLLVASGLVGAVVRRRR